MKGKNKQLLEILLDGDEPHKGRDLESLLGCSGRTVRNIVLATNKELAVLDIRIQASRRDGYYVSQEDKKIIFSQLELIYDDYYDYFPNEKRSRCYAMLVMLLMHDGWMSLGELSEKLYVSRATAQSDMQDAKVLAQGYGLGVEVSPRRGHRISCSETDRRLAIRNILMYEASDPRARVVVLSLASGRGEAKRHQGIAKATRSFVLSNKLKLRSHSIESFVLDCLLADIRVSQGHALPLPEDPPLGIARAQECLSDVLELPQAEWAWIELRLVSSLLSREDSTDLALAGEVVQNVSALMANTYYLGTDRFDHDRLTNRLAMVFHKANAHDREKNQLAPTIFSQYPLATELALCIADEARLHGYELSADDIADLALYFTDYEPAPRTTYRVGITSEYGERIMQFLQREIDGVLAGYSLSFMPLYPYEVMDMLEEGNAPEVDVVLNTDQSLIRALETSNVRTINVCATLTAEDKETVRVCFADLDRENARHIEREQLSHLNTSDFWMAVDTSEAIVLDEGETVIHTLQIGDVLIAHSSLAKSSIRGYRVGHGGAFGHVDAKRICIWSCDLRKLGESTRVLGLLHAILL